jgi:lysophospholipase L1-like esterase
MKSILCFGDSLTWGFVPNQFSRHSFDVRWPNAMAARLGTGYHVIEEGLNGRTTAYDDETVFEERNGAKALPMLLATHQPLDLLIIMLGANDLKYVARRRAFDAHLGMARLIDIAKTMPLLESSRRPDILIMSPPPVTATHDEFFAQLFNDAVEESEKLAYWYRKLAQAKDVHFFDAGQVAETSPLDAVHMDAENTRALGEALAPVVMTILNGETRA